MLARVLTWLLAATILIPLAGALALALLPDLSERAVSRWVLAFTWISSIASVAAIVIWLSQGAAPFRSAQWSLISHAQYQFRAGLMLDAAAAVFLVLVQFTSGMVIRFSRIYMHREPGFGRFFSVILMFRGAMCLLTLAEHLRLLFVGWELVGLASFLLIAFYHERPQAVRNALKTFSVYRIADVGMLLGACLEYSSGHALIGILLLLAAAGKSAQLPFCFWIARAMEGPTPSSALFYGALSVHAGAYLLLRTYSIWGGEPLVHLCVGILGLLTAIFCTFFSRTQHTIKGQVGYASVTQVGLIFVELALGLRWIALIHISANALLRCYQLLVSPSAVAYLLRRQSAAGTAKVSEERSLARRVLPLELRSTLYVFALSEGYLEAGIRNLFWVPVRKLGAALARAKGGVLGVALSLVLAVIFRERGPQGSGAGFLVFGFVALSAGLSFIAEISKHPAEALEWVFGSNSAAAFAVFAAIGAGNGGAALVYGTGAFASCILACGFMRYGSGRFAMGGTLIGVLGLMGFPFLPTFFWEDQLLHESFALHPVLAVLLSCVFALNGYVAMRAFSFYGKGAL